jgi:O-acetyl-ADP-ribose deacetylase (regulator of RNase III)
MKEKFSGKTFGLPMIGAGLAGGDWDIIEGIIQEELNGEDVTVVKYVP